MDERLWNSIPSVRAERYPGKHDTYVYGQSSADGTACIGCSWQTSQILSGPAAVAEHDHAMKTEHQHQDWVPLEHGLFIGTCPCGHTSAERSVLHTRVLAALELSSGTSFTTEQLADFVTHRLVPPHHLLVDFEAVTDHEPGDWELSLAGYDFTELSSPELLDHRVSNDELARLYFQIEAVGTLGEMNAYADLDKLMKQLGEAPAVAARDKAATNRHEQSQLRTDADPTETGE